MQRRTYLLGLFVFALPALLAARPTQASETKLAAAVQLRTGPGDSYPDVKRLAKGLGVDVHGCLRTWDWCDVEWRGARGWVPAHIVEFQRDERHLPLSRYGTTLGVPVVGFSLGKYWDAYYNQQPWYADRDRWMQRSARYESGGVLLENAVDTRRAQVANVPVNPPVTEPLSAPVNAVPARSPVTTTTATVTTTIVTPVDPDF